MTSKQGRKRKRNGHDGPQMESSIMQVVDLIELDLQRQSIVKHGRFWDVVSTCHINKKCPKRGNENS
jgi:hypothetical protein